ncbi:hypothetical protein O0I10_009326 [Lichtheimia ornata]|uniref:Uncharacterized protein n=1 Tax=Lichtheimia ornata TaxID=688661 RepID=A0AAD7UXV9_9FUNG|nr:uncharacterized protein O0I10_009326 [Lichtheimia ornata]KAJ8654931.1 hypothetical protein O0I10_009326 [Lichtheimia ornata]
MTAVMLDQFGSNLVHVATVTVGASQSYYFRQKLSDEKTSACNYRQPKQIIPSVPRTRTRPPPGSSLSPIRSHKLPPRRGPVSSFSSSPQKSLASIPLPPLSTSRLPQPPPPPQTTSAGKQRKRKVSFDNQVVVVHTVIQADDDEDIDDPNSTS